MTTAVHPAALPSGYGNAVPIRVWDRVVRVTHWIIAIATIVLAVTGIYIGRPFLTVAGPANQHFVTGIVKATHSYAAIAFTLAVLSRILWMFVGTRYARWYNFLPITRRRWSDLGQTFKFYIFARRDPPPSVGHNPLAGFTYIFVFLLYLLMIATGFALYSGGANVNSPMRMFRFLIPMLGGLQFARTIHHIGMWLLLGFVVHHIYSAVYMAIVERNATMESIFSGTKFVPTDLAEHD